VALTRAPENVGENHDIIFEAPFTLSLAGHIDMLFFRCFCLYLWFLLIVRVKVVSCRVTLSCPVVLNLSWFVIPFQRLSTLVTPCSTTKIPHFGLGFAGFFEGKC